MARRSIRRYAPEIVSCLAEQGAQGRSAHRGAAAEEIGTDPRNDHPTHRAWSLENVDRQAVAGHDTELARQDIGEENSPEGHIATHPLAIDQALQLGLRFQAHDGTPPFPVIMTEPGGHGAETFDSKNPRHPRQ